MSETDVGPARAIAATGSTAEAAAAPSAAGLASAGRADPVTSAPSLAVEPLDDGVPWAVLFDAARAAQRRAYAPYSRFAVGAALLDEHGVVHPGCNVENAAYPEGVCAEAGALSALVVAGGRRLRAVVVVGDGDGLVTPCGGCRQKLREFGAPDLPIRIGDRQRLRARYTLAALLPESFGPGHLGEGGTA